jgi:branched-chain amino acid transport system substrate-binding protein
MERDTLDRRNAMKKIGAGAVAATGLLSAKSILAQGNTNVLKIASVVSKSGFYAQYGHELTRGLEIAVEAVNRKGIRIGDTTYTLKYDVIDDKSDASTAARLVERASSEGANVVIAGVGSLIGKSIIPVSQRSRIPVIAQWAQLDNVFAGQKGNPYYFSTMPPFSGCYDSTWEQVAKLDKPKVRKVVMISPNDELGALVNKGLPESLKKHNLELAHVEFFPPATQDFGAALERCARHKPDILLVNAYTPQILAVFKQMQSVKFLPSVIIVEAPTHLVEGIGKPIEGVFSPTFWSADVNKTKDEYIGTSKDFARLYKEKFKALPPDFVAACGANNVIVYAKAAARAKSPTDNASLLTALRNFEGETFFSQVKFNDSGMNIRTTAHLGQFQDGKFILVAPDSVRQAAPIHPYRA